MLPGREDVACARGGRLLIFEGGPGVRGQRPRGCGLLAAGGALPLLSVIGFGVLLGGIASAMKTRN